MPSYVESHGLPTLAELAPRFAETRVRVSAAAHRTPVMTSRTLDECLRATVFLKCESFQRMGAFKFRGAWNFLSRLPADVLVRGVVAYSSGNHAQAVALVARELGVPATIKVWSAVDLSCEKKRLVRSCEMSLMSMPSTDQMSFSPRTSVNLEAL